MRVRPLGFDPFIYVRTKKEAKTGSLLLTFGGDEGDRTLDLVIANHALSQLSYIPIFNCRHRIVSQQQMSSLFPKVLAICFSARRALCSQRCSDFMPCASATQQT